MRVTTLAIALFLISATAAYAGGGCYSTREAEAEQGIRIHSELMVIGLNCQHMTPVGQRNLYAQYRTFTSNYSDLISGYEDTLINYFRRIGHPNPVASLNLMRTAFANKISLDAARMRPDIFCKRYTKRISQASAMNRQEVRQWASTFYPSHPVSKPICR